jgi:hypothetical protein
VTSIRRPAKHFRDWFQLHSCLATIDDNDDDDDDGGDGDIAAADDYVAAGG